MRDDFFYSLPVTIFKEGKAFVAYTPALDLSTAGKTEVQARRMFEEAVEAFLEELIAMQIISDRIEM
jgi:predicted RNase H-like HicB family nuclease